MSYSQSYDHIMERHMHELRSWGIPNSTPSTMPLVAMTCAPTPLSMTINHQCYPGTQHIDYYNYQPPVVNTRFTPHPILQRAQTYHTLNELDFRYQRPVTPVSAAMDDMTAFDDYEAASCYSDTPSSFVSSDMTDRSGYESAYSVASRQTPSVTSQPASLLLQQPFSEVDNLMQAIKPTQNSSPVSTSPQDSTDAATIKPKKHNCPYLDCSKSFSQPTHLKIHLRSHTGEKPYTCSVSTCGQRFSQLGNLRTHERRHVGQRPNRKRSSSDPGQRGKRYECILDGCRTRSTVREHGQIVPSGKVFTQLGNLKAHMNKFHKETLARLSDQFAAHTEEDQELREYFSSLFKNSNKGIKGRGKGRRVEVIVDHNSYHSINGVP